jgi:hypothetical protein
MLIVSPSGSRGRPSGSRGRPWQPR